jgi:hypothetical protein
MTPLPEIGSTASAASPTAIHGASWAARRRRWLSAGKTRGPQMTGRGSPVPTRAAVALAARSISRHPNSTIRSNHGTGPGTGRSL